MTNSKQAAKKEARSHISRTVKSIGVREFVRGGIDNVTEPIVVMSHSDELGMWLPRGQYEAFLGVNGTYYAAFSTPTSSSMPTGDPLAASATVTASSFGLRSFAADSTLPLTTESINQAVESAVERTITRLMGDKKGDTSDS